jgi:hypothetical protein
MAMRGMRCTINEGDEIWQREEERGEREVRKGRERLEGTEKWEKGGKGE